MHRKAVAPIAAARRRRLPAEDLERLRRLGGLDPDRDVREQLLLQPVLDVARGDPAAVAPREGRGVHGEDHRDRRLVDVEGGKGGRGLGRGHRLADLDAVEAAPGPRSRRRPPRPPRCASRPSKTWRLVTRVVSRRPSRFATATVSPTRTRPEKRRPIASRPRWSGKSCFGCCTKICKAPSVSCFGSGTTRKIVSNSVTRFSPIFGEGPGDTAAPRSHKHRLEVALLVVRVEIEEQREDFVQDLSARASWRSILLITTTVGIRAAGPCEHEARLRQRALRRIDEQQDPVDHLQGALHLARRSRSGRACR